MYRRSILLLCGWLTAGAATAGVEIQVTRFDDPVPDGCLPTDCSLREAVIEANGNGLPNTIGLNPGTYTLSLPDSGPNTALDGDLDILDELVISGAGAGATLIDGGGIDRIFDIPTAGYAVEIRDLTIQNGESNSGGGIFNAGDLTLRNCEITGNHADNGGGGVTNHLSGVLSISNCRLTSNEASNPGGGGSGGALSNRGIATIENSVLDDNWAEGTGGAIAIDEVNPPAQMSIDESTISNNTANTGMQWFGGGGIINGGQLTISSSSIIGNSAARSDGGGLNNWSPATLINVTLSGNSAASEGGAVRNVNGGININASTIVDNTAPDTGGVFAEDVDAYFQTSIVAGNIGGNCNLPFGEGDCDYPSIDSGNSCDFCPQFVNLDPMLEPLSDNGGPTQTYALLEGSPAIDGANPLSFGHGCPFLGNPPVALDIDQRGFPRPIDGDDNGSVLCDLGAFEFSAEEIFRDGFESGNTSAWSASVP
jgi:hypothetical protein